MMNAVKNRAVIITKEDYTNLEFMLWLFDIRVMKHFKDVEFRATGTGRNVNYDVVIFRCSDNKYSSIYEKMDGLGMWKGECINPKFEGRTMLFDEANVLFENLTNRYLMIGV